MRMLGYQDNNNQMWECFYSFLWEEIGKGRGSFVVSTMSQCTKRVGIPQLYGYPEYKSLLGSTLSLLLTEIQTHNMRAVSFSFFGGFTEICSLKDNLSDGAKELLQRCRMKTSVYM